MMTRTDLQFQVRTATDASVGTYDVDGIVDTIQDLYGRVNIDTIAHDEFWAIVIDHATDEA